MRPSPTRDPEYAALETACPYHRPFPKDFSGCPAFTPVEFRGTDLRGRHLIPVLSCAHLHPARRTDSPGTHFGACRLGTPADREAWAQSHQPGNEL